MPKYTPVLATVTEQPLLDSKEDMFISSDARVSHPLPHSHSRCACDRYADDELMYHNSDSPYSHTHGQGHRRCHNARVRRYVLPLLSAFLVLLLLLGGMVVLGCMHADGMGAGVGSLVDLAGEGLFARQVGPGAGSGSGTGGSFTHHKLYLIVIFVGLFLVLVLGIMLAAWCCRGSFENPLCCPCYLCACCGGLACLDCIACGLCADAAEQM